MDWSEVPTVIKARARVVVQSYQEGGNVRNAFLVLTQALGEDRRPSGDVVVEAFEMVKAAAVELHEDGAAVIGKVVMG